MINNIRQFFTTKIIDPMGDEQHQQHLAAAALMVEVMVIDRKISNKERIFEFTLVPSMEK